jgi:hypothetical protein
MPAISNAIARATGVRFADLPITPEKILRAVRERDEAGAEPLVEAGTPVLAGVRSP